MLFCRSCGSRIPEEAGFCGSCGQRIAPPLDLPTQRGKREPVMPSEPLITPLPFAVQPPASGPIPTIPGAPQISQIPTIPGAPQPPGFHPLPGQPMHSGGSAAGSAHAPSGGQSVPHGWHQGPAHGAASQGMVHGAASHGVAHGLRHLLSTVTGKIVAVAVVTAVVAASVVTVVLTHRGSGFASAYQGMAHNITVNATGPLVLTSLVEDQQKISGKVFWGFPLIGNGSFTGTMGSNGSVTLTDTPVDGFASQIIFQGSVHPDGSLSGTYTAPGVSQTGTWQTAPYQVPSSRQVVPTYHGTVQNLAVGGTATLALTSLVEDQQKISGNVAIGPGLIGSGSFTGTIEAEGGVNFTDNDTTDHFTITFRGFSFPDGSLSGSYTIPSSGQFGIWEAFPA